MRGQNRRILLADLQADVPDRIAHNAVGLCLSPDQDAIFQLLIVAQRGLFLKGHKEGVLALIVFIVERFPIDHSFLSRHLTFDSQRPRSEVELFEVVLTGQLNGRL